jgi:hypothetical protein
VPGLGAVYNGQYVKGIVHAAIFGMGMLAQSAKRQAGGGRHGRGMSNVHECEQLRQRVRSARIVLRPFVRLRATVASNTIGSSVLHLG